MNEPVVTYSPGRVNLIGDHTDYNGGFVMPAAIPQQTRVEIKRRDDHTVSATSLNMDLPSAIQYELGEETPRGTWIDYIQGITRVLSDSGHNLSGFDVRIQSQVPVGSGLSSSAALAVSLLKALDQVHGLGLNEVAIARLCQRAENEFVGAPVGIMDPMACSLATPGHALFLDTQSLDYSLIPVPRQLMGLAVINSGIAHRNIGGGYSQRKQECEQACRILGVENLRQAQFTRAWENPGLNEILSRRVRHVITENDRVVAAARALRRGDAEQLGALFNESHRSLKEDYQVSLPEIDFLVELARTKNGVFGARLTGGGFGGSIVVLTWPGREEKLAAEIARRYHDETGLYASVVMPPGSAKSAPPPELSAPR